MYDINTLKEFASIKPYELSDSQRVTTLLRAAEKFQVSPNAFVNMFRSARNTIRGLSERELCDLDTALLQALVRVALFNSRRCYHTYIQSR